MDRFIGIDLGTTQTKATVGWFVDKKIIRERLPLWQSGLPLGELAPRNKLPSVLWLEGNKVDVGEFCDKNAMNLVGGDSHLVRSIKREMGNSVWSVESNGFRYRPYQLAAFLLITVRRSFERAYPNEAPSRITITIPASYSSAMRRATLDAAVLAGFPIKHVQLIDEPLAAYFSLYPNELSEIDEPVVVFDMGGGTLDASVIKRVGNHEFELLGTSRYNEISGDDLTLEIAALIVQEARRNKVPIDTFAKGFGVGIWNLAEAMKENSCQILVKNAKYGSYDEQIGIYQKSRDSLSPGPSTQIKGLSDVKILVCDLLRAVQPFFEITKFEEPNSRSIRRPIYQALSQAGIEPQSVKCVYTTGGSSVFPPVLETLNQVFRGRIVNLDPYHTVADGALNWTAMHSIGALKVKEKIFENLYLRQAGRGFAQVFKAPINVPTQGEKEFSPDETQPVLPVQGRRLTVDFFRGASDEDPLMTAAHSGFVKLIRTTNGKVKLEKVTYSVDAYKIYKCELILKDTSGIIQAKVEFDSSSPTQDFDSFKLPSDLVLNGEKI